MQGWVDWFGWLEMDYTHNGHHHGTNLTRCWLTWLMRPTTLITTLSRQPCVRPSVRACGVRPFVVDCFATVAYLGTLLSSFPQPECSTINGKLNRVPGILQRAPFTESNWIQSGFGFRYRYLSAPFANPNPDSRIWWTCFDVGFAGMWKFQRIKIKIAVFDQLSEIFSVLQAVA